MDTRRALSLPELRASSSELLHAHAKPVDVLIPLGTGSRWENNELRYCLRSIELFAIGYARIFIIGEFPPFLRASEFELRHLPCLDINANKQARIAHKIEHAFRESDISDRACLFNDDYILNCPTDLRALPCYQKGTLAHAADVHNDPSYRASLRETHNALRVAGKFTLHYDLHLPIVFDRHKFVGLEPFWIASRKAANGFVVKSVYCNNALDETPGPEHRDCKLSYFSQGVIETHVERPERFCFSYNDRALDTGLKEWLAKRFPRKSTWERE